MGIYQMVMSKTSIFAKFFEKIVESKISSLLNSMFFDEQHGLIERRWTVSNLLVYVQFLLHTKENAKQVDTVYTDFAKAFAEVNNRLLIEKLKSFGLFDQ